MKKVCYVKPVLQVTRPSPHKPSYVRTPLRHVQITSFLVFPQRSFFFKSDKTKEQKIKEVSDVKNQPLSGSNENLINSLKSSLASSVVEEMMLQKLVGQGRFLDAEQTFQSFKERGVTLTIPMFRTLLMGVQQQKSLQKIFWVLDEMKQVQLQPTYEMYNQILLFLVKSGGVDDVNKFMEEQMRGQGINPTVHNYSIMVDYFGRLGNLTNMLSFFDKMLEDGLSPGVDVFNHVLSVLAKNKDTQLLEKYFSLMKIHKTEPNLTTYTTLIETCAREGEVKLMLKYFEAMKGGKIKPHIPEYKLILNTLVKKSDVVTLAHYFDEMLTVVKKPYVTLFNLVMQKMLQEFNTDRVLLYYGELESREIEPDKLTYNLVMQAFAMRKDTDGITSWFELMKHKNVQLDETTQRLVLETMKAEQRAIFEGIEQV